MYYLSACINIYKVVPCICNCHEYNTVESFLVIVPRASSRWLLGGKMFPFYGSQTVAPPGAELLSNFLSLILCLLSLYASIIAMYTSDAVLHTKIFFTFVWPLISSIWSSVSNCSKCPNSYLLANHCFIRTVLVFLYLYFSLYLQLIMFGQINLFFFFFLHLPVASAICSI